nr:uncharacterized protein CTRU02_14079 [Colletotrichum truncatum]KAF6782598.1 hypothetical protein CTRU02_14079 [Colletotrichum truncatum]
MKRRNRPCFSEKAVAIETKRANLFFLRLNRAFRATVCSSCYSLVPLQSYSDTCPDSFSDQTRRALSLGTAPSKDVLSLQNWVENSSCLSRDETAYLEEEADLAPMACSKDSAVEKLEDWVEGKLIHYYRGFRKSPLHNVSNDANVYIYSGSLVKGSARALMLCLATGLILIPVIICLAVDSAVARVLVIILSTVSFLSVLSQLTNARMMELVLAGATFATVLTVFVSGENPPPVLAASAT